MRNVECKRGTVPTYLFSVIASEHSERSNLKTEIASSPSAPRNDVVKTTIPTRAVLFFLLLLVFLASPLAAETTRFEVRAIVPDSETDSLIYDVFTRITPEGTQESVKASKDVLLVPSDMDSAIVYFRTDGKQPLPHAQWIVEPTRGEVDLKLANLDTVQLQLEPVVELRLNDHGKKKWREVLRQSFSEGVAVTGNGLWLTQSTASELFSGGSLRLRVPGKNPSTQEILRFMAGLEIKTIKARAIPQTSKILKKSNFDTDLAVVNP